MKKFFTLAALAMVVTTATLAEDLPYTVVEKFPYAENVPETLKLLDVDRFTGEEDAPVQIIEYASMTCGHCADFHLNTYPKLKENYIDNGKVRFVVRPMPWDNRALAVSLIAHCAPAEQHKNFLSAFFSTQQQWARSATFLEDVKKIARLGGMDGDAVEKCVSDPDVRRAVDAVVEMGRENLAVRATPTFFINGERFEGSVPYADLANYLDELLAK